jgi:hypothetical protein
MLKSQEILYGGKFAWLHPTELLLAFLIGPASETRIKVVEKNRDNF